MMTRLSSLLHAVSADGACHIAYSGGLDSRFLSHAVQLAGLRPVLYHITGPHIPDAETAFACGWAAERGFVLHLLPVDPLTLPAVASGARDRCYHCKKELFTRILALGARPLCDGSNLSDRGGYRPGLRALAELGVRSPLAEAELSKAQIRQLARETGLERPEQRARPCLLTRLDYDLAPESGLLAQLAAMEAVLEDVLHGCFAHEAEAPDFRVRYVRREGGPEWWLQVDRALSPEQEALLARTLRQADLPVPQRLPAEQGLSGFFDRPAPSTVDSPSR